MDRFIAVPLADKGFVSVSDNNRVRWYVEDSERPHKLVGPFVDMSAADAYAAEMNRS